MDVTPKTLREVEFRERMRGYHPEDVDHFLEEVAAGLEVLQERMRQSVERAQRAETAAAEAGGNDEALRKTLVLAQRTADLAVQEAREQAARILAGAEQQAQSLLADAEQQSRLAMEEATAETRAALARLETSRAEAQRDVDTLNRWLEEHKAHLVAALREATEAVEHAGVMWAAPSTQPIESGFMPQTQSNSASPAPSESEAEPVADETTAMWTPTEDDLGDAAPNPGQPDSEKPNSGQAAPWPPAVQSTQAPTVVSEAADSADDRALDDFFEDNDDELEDDRRFGGRLRRRR
jgi:DivIVA domain-containing protein